MKEVAITGATFTGNRGAEAMLVTVIGRIHDKDPGVICNVFSYYPTDDRLVVKDKRIRVFSLTPAVLVFFMFPLSILLALFRVIGLGVVRHVFPRSIRAYYDSRVLIDIAGVSFMDGRAKFLPYNILTLLPAVILGTPVVKMSQAMGSFKEPVVRRLSKLFLPLCNRIYARGNDTLNNLKDIQLPKGKYELAADVTFMHQEGDSLSEENTEYLDSLCADISESSHGGTVVGVCPSAVIASKAEKMNWDYTDFLVQTVKQLIARGNRVILFPNATRESYMAKLRNNDLPVILSVVKRLQDDADLESSFCYVEKDINADGIKKLIHMMDVTLVFRFHAMLACLSMKKPVLVVGWSHKYLEVMEQFDLGNWVFDYKGRNESDIVGRVQLLIENQDLLHKQIETVLPRVVASSRRQFDYIFSLIGI